MQLNSMIRPVMQLKIFVLNLDVQLRIDFLESLLFNYLPIV